MSSLIFQSQAMELKLSLCFDIFQIYFEILIGVKIGERS